MSGASQAEALELSRRMLEAARGGAWEEVAALDERRRELLAGAALPPATWEALLALHEEVLALAERARQEALEGLEGLRRGQAARKAYGGCP